jgi:hypothetical protein
MQLNAWYYDAATTEFGGFCHVHYDIIDSLGVRKLAEEFASRSEGEYLEIGCKWKWN